MRIAIAGAGGIGCLVGARLAADKSHQIKAVAVVHNETSTGAMSDIAAVRRAIDEARHDQEQQGAGAAGGGGDAAPTAARPAGVVNMDDFDSALYFLDEGEVRYLKDEVGAEYSSDLRRVTLDMLLDIFELQVDPLVRREIVGHIDALVLHLLAGRQFGNVAYLLRETSSVLERAREVPPEARERMLQGPPPAEIPKRRAVLGSTADQPVPPHSTGHAGATQPRAASVRCQRSRSSRDRSAYVHAFATFSFRSVGRLACSHDRTSSRKALSSAE